MVYFTALGWINLRWFLLVDSEIYFATSNYSIEFPRQTFDSFFNRMIK